MIITYCARPSLRPSSRPGLLFAQSLSIQSWWSLAAWLQSIPTALKAGDASDPALPSPFFNRSAHRTSYNAAFASCTPLYCSRDFQPQRRFGNTGLSQCVRPWCDLERAALANCTRRGSTRKKTSLSLSLFPVSALTYLPLWSSLATCSMVLVSKQRQQLGGANMHGKAEGMAESKCSGRTKKHDRVETPSTHILPSRGIRDGLGLACTVAIQLQRAPHTHTPLPCVGPAHPASVQQKPKIFTFPSERDPPHANRVLSFL